MVTEPILEPTITQEEELEGIGEGEESDEYELEVLCYSFSRQVRHGLFLLTSDTAGRRRRRRLSTRGRRGRGRRGRSGQGRAEKCKPVHISRELTPI